jgi:hypothetical protein
LTLRGLRGALHGGAARESPLFVDPSFTDL